jgi:glycosyltransferase involved in cell wall biosynthesis
MATDADVTLVMPVWKPHPEWFREAVASALAQTGCRNELVVVDDGNDEPVEPLLADLADDRVSVVRIEHGGVAAARNAGMALVTTPYVRHIDADDVLTPDGTALLLAHATPDTIVHGATAECTVDLTPTGKQFGSTMAGDVVEACVLAQFDTRHVSMLYPTAVASAVSWDPTIRVCSDRDYVLQCVERAPVVPIPDVVTHYRRHDASVSRRAQARDAAWLGQRRVLEKYFERHPEAKGTRLHRAAWSVFHEAWARRALAEGATSSFVRSLASLASVDRRAALGVVQSATAKVLRRGARVARRR